MSNYSLEYREHFSYFRTSMVSVNNLSYYIGSRPIYEKASLHIKPKDRIGLIGLNGTGKSTLLKLIDGDYAPSEGSIEFGKEVTIGFLNQDLLSYQSDEPIVDVALQAFKETLDMQHKIDAILKKMETDYSDELLHKLSTLQEKFETLGGYALRSRAEEVLEGIGFSTEDLERPLREFSGGWRMRVMLAKLLLEEPSLLMMDEPTNHLDLPSIEWIENYLNSYPGAIIVVSHDRQFIRNVSTKIVEVSGRQLNLYNGNYDFFLEEKELREEIQNNAFRNQQQHIKQTEKFIERFRAKASKARQVQSRVKQLERLDLIDEVAEEAKAISIKFTPAKPSGKEIVRLKNISKSFGDNVIFDHASATIYRGDKIALIGANGKGKSTLLRIIDGMEKVEGSYEEGYNVEPAFYAQHQLESLGIDHEIIEELKLAGSGKTELELRTILGCFLFTSDDVFKKIKVLSGGEKSRVALAKTLISNANFLLLDEPTNHLDTISENILIQALQQYEGSYITVSHNRHFIEQVANKIWYIEDRKIKEYPGTFAEYNQWMADREEDANRKESAARVSKPPKKTKKPESTTSAKKSSSTLKKEIQFLEGEIERIEKKKSSLEKELSDESIYSDQEQLAVKNNEYKTITEKLGQMTLSWEALVEQLEK